MYVVAVTFEITPDAFEAFLVRVKQQADDSLTREPACHRFDVCCSETHPNRVFLYELYDDREAFDLHLQSEHFKAFDVEVAAHILSKQVETWHLED